jgi:CHAT domain-containing protein
LFLNFPFFSVQQAGLSIHSFSLTVALLVSLVAVITADGANVQNRHVFGSVASPNAPAQDPCRNPNELISNAQRLYSEWRRPSLEKAIENYLKAKDCFQKSSDVAASADALKAVGDIYFILSDYQKSNDSYLQALTLRKQLPDRSVEAGAIADVAFSLVYLGDKDQAKQRAEEAVQLSEVGGDTARQAQTHYVLGTALLFGGDSRAGLVSLNRALLLVDKTKNRELYARILLTIGYVHNNLDDLERALGFYNDALVEWRALQHRWGEARTLTSIGLVQILMGDRQSALDALEATLPVVEQMGDRLSHAAVLNNIAYAYQTLGELNQALEYFNKALAIYQSMKFVLGEAVTLQYCGDVQALMGHSETAIATYDVAIQRTREVGNQLLLADGLNSLGSIYFTRGDRQKAIELFDQSLNEYRKASHWRGLASVLSNIGYYNEIVVDKSKARDYYIEALSYARSAQDREAAASILYNLARVEASLGLGSEAQSHIEESLKINEASRAKVASQDLRISYLASVHQHYEFYIDLLMQLHQRNPKEGFDVKALQASERARARSLLEFLNQTNVSLRQKVDPDLQQRERTLRAALNAEYFKSSDGSTQQTENRRKLESEYEDVKIQLRTKSFNYASIALPPNVELSQIQQQLLDSDTAILEYSLGERRSFLWVLTAGSLKTYELPAKAELEREAEKLLKYFASFGNDGNTNQPKLIRSPEDETVYWQQSAKLSSLLFQNALAQTTAKRLVIVADGVLQSVPYAALTKPGLMVQKDNSPRPLIADYEVLNLPSISVLAVLNKQLTNGTQRAGSVAIIADPVFDANDPRLRTAQRQKSGDRPVSESAQSTFQSSSRLLSRAVRNSPFEKGIPRLVFSRREAQAILAVRPNSFAALDFRANRAAAISGELAKYGIIHFATHGLVNSEHPELSGILLSMVDERGARQDGFLQLSDIYDLSLPADLVVLSACESGLGKTVKGEGLIGLTRGFMYAGAARVVATLWKVDDSATAELMGEFYRQMFINKKRPPEALKEAQLSISRQKRWQSPYYWAGFVLQGEWR